MKGGASVIGLVTVQESALVTGDGTKMPAEAALSRRRFLALR